MNVKLEICEFAENCEIAKIGKIVGFFPWNMETNYISSSLQVIKIHLVLH